MTWAICRASVSRQGHSHPWKVGGGSESHPCSERPYCKRIWSTREPDYGIICPRDWDAITQCIRGWIWSFGRMLITRNGSSPWLLTEIRNSDVGQNLIRLPLEVSGSTICITRFDALPYTTANKRTDMSKKNCYSCRKLLHHANKRLV